MEFEFNRTANLVSIRIRYTQDDFAFSKFPKKRLTRHFGTLAPVFWWIELIDLQSLVSLMHTQTEDRSEELNVAYNAPIDPIARNSSFFHQLLVDFHPSISILELKYVNKSLVYHLDSHGVIVKKSLFVHLEI